MSRRPSESWMMEVPRFREGMILVRVKSGGKAAAGKAKRRRRRPRIHLPRFRMDVEAAIPCTIFLS
jgi:hypothetical protein